MLTLDDTLRLADDVFRRIAMSERARPHGILRAVTANGTAETWIRRGALILRGTIAFEQLYVATPWSCRVVLTPTIAGGALEPRATSRGAHVYAIPREMTCSATSRSWHAAAREIALLAHEVAIDVQSESMSDRWLRHPPHDTRLNAALTEWQKFSANGRRAPPLTLEQEKTGDDRPCQASGA